MRLLIDTHLLIWAGEGSQRLSRAAAVLLADEANTLLFSTISVAEVAIKRALGRADFQIDPRDFRQKLFDNGYSELPLTGEHACRLGDLPPVHKDPFDRLLVAQAQIEGLSLLTADAVLGGYGAVVRVVG